MIAQRQSAVDHLDMRGLVLFGSTTCAPCKEASDWLDANGIDYVKYKVDNARPEIIDWLVQTTGQRHVPLFFYNKQPIPGGLADVKRLAQAGRLARRPTVTQLPESGVG